MTQQRTHMVLFDMRQCQPETTDEVPRLSNAAGSSAAAPIPSNPYVADVRMDEAAMDEDGEEEQATDDDVAHDPNQEIKMLLDEAPRHFSTIFGIIRMNALPWNVGKMRANCRPHRWQF